MKTISFTAVVRSGGGVGTTCFIALPKDSAERFGTRARVPIVGTVNGVAIRTSAMPTGHGNHEFMFNKAMRERAGAGPGDAVKVRLRVDTLPRGVSVPADLSRALTNAGARAQWDALAYSHRREYVDWLADAKRDETRARRIAKVMEAIAKGCKPRDSAH